MRARARSVRVRVVQVSNPFAHSIFPLYFPHFFRTFSSIDLLYIRRRTFVLCLTHNFTYVRLSWPRARF